MPEIELNYEQLFCWSSMKVINKDFCIVKWIIFIPYEGLNGKHPKDNCVPFFPLYKYTNIGYKANSKPGAVYGICIN